MIVVMLDWPVKIVALLIGLFVFLIGIDSRKSFPSFYLIMVAIGLTAIVLAFWSVWTAGIVIALFAAVLLFGRRLYQRALSYEKRK